MFNVIRQAKERQTFLDEVERSRLEEIKKRDISNPSPAVFNQKHYSPTGGTGVVLTPSVRKILKKNRTRTPGFSLTSLELKVMRNVVDSLTQIHENNKCAKDALSHVVTLEEYDSYQHIDTRIGGDILPDQLTQESCLYILKGSVEVMYDKGSLPGVQIFNINILYFHSAGEYIGPTKLSVLDEATSATIYTREASVFLRIPLTTYTQVLNIIDKKDKEEKHTFVSRFRNLFSVLKTEQLEYLCQEMVKQENNPETVLVSQGRKNKNDISFIASGNYVLDTFLRCPVKYTEPGRRHGTCRCYRSLHHSHNETMSVFEVDHLEAGDVVGLDALTAFTSHYSSDTSVVCQGFVTCYTLSRSACNTLGTAFINHLHNVCKTPNVPSDSELVQLNRVSRMWDSYKNIMANKISNAKAVKQFNKLTEDAAYTQKMKICNFLLGNKFEDTNSKATALSKIKTDEQRDWKKMKTYIHSAYPLFTSKNLSQSKVVKGTGTLEERQPRFLKDRRTVGSTGSRYDYRMSRLKFSNESPLESRDVIKQFQMHRQISFKNRAAWIYGSEAPNVQGPNSLPNVDTREIIERAKYKAVQFHQRRKNRISLVPEDESTLTDVFLSEHGRAKDALAFSRYRIQVLETGMAAKFGTTKDRKDAIRQEEASTV